SRCCATVCRRRTPAIPSSATDSRYATTAGTSPSAQPSAASGSATTRATTGVCFRHACRWCMRFVSPDQKDVARVDVDQNDESVSSVGRFGRLKQINFGQFVTTLANLGVLAGLLLVAVQISQGTEI